MIFREVSPDVFERWTGGDVGELRLPPVGEVAANWSDDELEAIGLYRLPDPDPDPAGKVIVSRSVQRVEGVVKWVYELADAPAPTPEQVIEQFRVAIQAHVDATAQSRRYDNGISLASYVNSTVPQWAAEATAFVAWRDAVWAYSYAELDKVLNEEREQPTVEDFLAELPAISWPD